MQKKILIIEDSAVTVSMLTARIETEGYQVISAEDGTKGLDMMRQDNPDLVILDIRMPGMDGFEVCRIAKNDLQLKKIPIIIVTTATQEKDKQKGKDLGADLYITKPYDGQQLLREIDNILK